MELDGVADEVLPEGGQQHRVARHRGQTVRRRRWHPVLGHQFGQALECGLHARVERNGHERVGGAADPGERQQVVDEGLHPSGPVHREPDVLVGPRVELVLVARLEELDEARHLAEGLLEVVGGHVGELLQLLVRPLEVAVAFGQVGTGRGHLVEFAHDPQTHRLDVVPHLGDLRGADGRHRVRRARRRRPRSYRSPRSDSGATTQARSARSRAMPASTSSTGRTPGRRSAGRWRRTGSAPVLARLAARAASSAANRAADGVEPDLAGTEQLLLDLERVAGAGGDDAGDGEVEVPVLAGFVGGRRQGEQVAGRRAVRAEVGVGHLLVVVAAHVRLGERRVLAQDVAADAGLLVEVRLEQLVGGEARRIDLGR